MESVKKRVSSRRNEGDQLFFSSEGTSKNQIVDPGLYAHSNRQPQFEIRFDSLDFWSPFYQEKGEKPNYYPNRSRRTLLGLPAEKNWIQPPENTEWANSGLRDSFRFQNRGFCYMAVLDPASSRSWKETDVDWDGK